jgi:CPA1 family monovalent cation:H+ antiporter
MVQILEIFTLLLLIAFVLLTVAKKLGIPNSIILVLSGFIISLLKFNLQFEVSYEVIMLIFIPALVFKEALTMDIRNLNKEKWPVLALVLVGIIIQVLLLGYILHWTFGFALLHAFLFSVIIIPTDPVGVVNILEETGSAERIKIIAESESLFDDAVAIIIYGTLMSILLGDKAVNLSFFMEFLFQEVILSLVLGLASGALAYILIKHTEDVHIRVIITLVTAFGGFLLATKLHSSGILLIVFAGLMLGNMHHLMKIENVIGTKQLVFWDFLTFLLTTILYLFIGIVIQNTHGLSEYIHYFPISLGIFLLMSVLRWLILFIFLKTIGTLQHEHFSLKIITFMALGSLKGPISLAMLIALPMALGMDFVIKVCIIGYTIILFSILVQGSLVKITASRLLDTPKK